MSEYTESTGCFWWSYEAATSQANRLTKETGFYISVIKGEPSDKEKPEECWATTNKYDPRVKR